MTYRLLFATGIATLCAVTLSGTAAFAETADERTARCEAQAEIVRFAVAHRLDKKREKRARRLVLKEETIKDGPYAETVDVLVNWVYQLPPEQLGPEATAAFQDACSQYKG